MIQPDVVIVKGIFIEPSDITVMVDKLYGENVVPKALVDMQEWKGYGDYHE